MILEEADKLRSSNRLIEVLVLAPGHPVPAAALGSRYAITPSAHTTSMVTSKPTEESELDVDVVFVALNLLEEFKLELEVPLLLL